MSVPAVHKTTNAQGMVEYWYDRSVRVWYASLVDETGSLLGTAVHAATRGEILELIEAGDLSTEYQY